MTMSPFAIVIPAYKSEFLHETLSSIAQQTREGLPIYVGDDASPFDIEAICIQFSGVLDIRYHRFPENLGQTSLTAHWNRCVKLSSEPWVWLFGDDDIMEAGCVDRLLDAITEEGRNFDLFHFNVTTIGAGGEVLREEKRFPSRLSVCEFAAARLSFDLASYAPDYVFSRAAFDRTGGFVDFPLAWCSDDATWISIAGSNGIRTLDGPRVRWRLSGQNISARSPTTVSRKVDALAQYLAWLYEELGEIGPCPGGPSLEDVMKLTPNWLYQQMRIMRGHFWPGIGLRTAWRLRGIPYHGFFRSVFRTIRFDLKALKRR